MKAFRVIYHSIAEKVTLIVIAENREAVEGTVKKNYPKAKNWDFNYIDIEELTKHGIVSIQSYY